MSDASVTTTTTTNSQNTVFVWVEDNNPDFETSAYEQTPTPYQWLRLGANIPFTAAGTITGIDEGANSADGFDLATGGSGRLFAPCDLFLIRNGSATATPAGTPVSNANNRLIAITASELLLAHDGEIVIGEAKGDSGHPSSVTINSAGNITLNSDLDTTQDIDGNEYKTTKGNTYEIQWGNAVNQTWGSKDSIAGGANTNVYLGLYTAFSFGMKAEFILLGKFEFNTGYEFKYVTSTYEFKPFKNEFKIKDVDLGNIKIIIELERSKMTTSNFLTSGKNTAIHALNTAVNSITTTLDSVLTNTVGVLTSDAPIKTDLGEIKTSTSAYNSEFTEKIYL